MKKLLLLSLLVLCCSAAQGQARFRTYLDMIGDSFRNYINVNFAGIGEEEKDDDHDGAPIYVGLAGAYNGSRPLSEMEIFGKAEGPLWNRRAEIGFGLVYRSFNAKVNGIGRQEGRSINLFAEGNIYPFHNCFYTGLRVDVLPLMGGLYNGPIAPYREENGQFLKQYGTFWVFANAGAAIPVSRWCELKVFVQPGFYFTGLNGSLKDAGIPLTAPRFNFTARAGVSLSFKVQ